MFFFNCLLHNFKGIVNEMLLRCSSYLVLQTPQAQVAASSVAAPVVGGGPADAGSAPRKGNGGHIMISYQWDKQVELIQVGKAKRIHETINETS